MKFIKLFIITLFLFSSINTVSAEQSETEKMIAVQKIKILDRPLLMVGMGLTQKMNDDYYVGVFYIDESAQYINGEDLAFMDVARRMEFRFASEHQVSGRGFARKLAENIRINNERDVVKKEGEKLARLLKLFKGTYKKGDFIRIDYHPSFGTRLFHNQKTLGTIQVTRDLYRLLVNTWVGERPPSSKFRLGIEGNNESNYAIELLKRYISLM